MAEVTNLVSRPWGCASPQLYSPKPGWVKRETEAQWSKMVCSAHPPPLLGHKARFRLVGPGLGQHRCFTPHLGTCHCVTDMPEPWPWLQRARDTVTRPQGCRSVLPLVSPPLPTPLRGLSVPVKINRAHSAVSLKIIRRAGGRHNGGRRWGQAPRRDARGPGGRRDGGPRGSVERPLPSGFGSPVGAGRVWGLLEDFTP